MKVLPRIIALAAVLAASTFAVSQGDCEDYVVLSLHDTSALFLGTHFTLCKGKTALCPYDCGGSGIVASFQVEHYNDYQRSCEWADEMADAVQFMVEATDGSGELCYEAREAVQQLAVGTRVHLVWQQLYPASLAADEKIPRRQVLLLEVED